jgi:hypothetical protein
VRHTPPRKHSSGLNGLLAFPISSAAKSPFPRPGLEGPVVVAKPVYCSLSLELDRNMGLRYLEHDLEPRRWSMPTAVRPSSARSILTSTSSVVYGARASLMSCCCPIRCVLQIFLALTTAKPPSSSRASWIRWVISARSFALVIFAEDRMARMVVGRWFFHSVKRRSSEIVGVAISSTLGRTETVFYPPQSSVSCNLYTRLSSESVRFEEIGHTSDLGRPPLDAMTLQCKTMVTM